jgi:anti-sigma-K factor RskA
MKCTDFRELIPEYVAGELIPEMRRQFDAHRMECRDCRAELEQTEALWMSLGEMPEEEPGPGLRSRFYAMLEDEKRRVARGSRAERIDAWLRAWWPRRPVVQLAIVISFLVLGLGGGSALEMRRGRDGEVARLRDQVQQMHQMVSLSLLGQQSSSERLRGVNWSARVTEPSETLLASLTSTLNSDPSENVRLAAVDALALFRNQPGVVDALTRALSEEDSPIVQIALIDLLTVIHEQKALDALRSFIEMKDVLPPVKQHAQERITDFM